jgi:TrmH family RNA methyltransferase
VEEALRSRCRVAAILASDSAASDAERIAGSTDIVYLSDVLFQSIAATETSQGVMALVEPPKFGLETVFAGQALAVVLDGIQDPGNAGTILRASEAFGATGAVLLKGTVNPYNPKAVRASAGSLFRLPVVAGVDTSVLILALKDTTLYAAMPRAEQLASQADFVRACAIAIGSEGRGVGQEVQARAQGVRIPTRSVESLNASVAAGVLLYEAARQRSG